MNLIRKGEAQLLEAHSLKGGQLRIGASDTICRYYLVPYLQRFHQEYPNVHIKVTNHTSIDCAKSLESGEVDFTIGQDLAYQPYQALSVLFEALMGQRPDRDTYVTACPILNSESI